MYGVVLITFSLLFPLAIELARMYLPLSLLKALFLSFKGGFIIGTQFPLANVIYIGDGQDYTKTAALLYAADLSGGFVAGVLAGVWLIPSLGINETFPILALMKFVSGCVFVAEFLVKGLKFK